MYLTIKVLDEEGQVCPGLAWRISPGNLANTLRHVCADVPQLNAWVWINGLNETINPTLALRATGRSVDLIHAGLSNGLAGLPRLLRFVSPTWMFSVDAPANIESTSWRVSLCSCLVKAEVLRQLGPPREIFATLEAAGLDWGLRCLRAGVILRHSPDLAIKDIWHPPVVLPVEDEVAILALNYGQKWTLWALWRAWRTGVLPLKDFLLSILLLRRLGSASAAAQPTLWRSLSREKNGKSLAVSVIIPTLDRYSYIETLLGQLERQTVVPDEVVVIDQTPAIRRRSDFALRYLSLNLRLLNTEEAGQSSARNKGIESAVGEWILFLDDDDEIPENYCERMLRVAMLLEADSVSGVVYTPGEDDPKNCKNKIEHKIYCSDVFPTNTTILRKSALSKSGCFDLRYDRGQLEDGDLGMRLYLSGALMLLDEGNCILHHHAPSGGLRAHGARVVTRAAARKSLWKRALPSPWSFYLALRYFGQPAAHEVAAIAVLQTFSAEGSPLFRTVRAIVGLLQLPTTILQVRKARIGGKRLAEKGPRIPTI